MEGGIPYARSFLGTFTEAYISLSPTIRRLGVRTVHQASGWCPREGGGGVYFCLTFAPCLTAFHCSYQKAYYCQHRGIRLQHIRFCVQQKLSSLFNAANEELLNCLWRDNSTSPPPYHSPCVTNLWNQWNQAWSIIESPEIPFDIFSLTGISV